jgi:hypothetical protein
MGRGEKVSPVIYLNQYLTHFSSFLLRVEGGRREEDEETTN